MADGTGWIPIDYAGLGDSAPISALPVDPTNNATYEYNYGKLNSGKYEVQALALESTEYATTQDKDAKDGGNNTATYEVGTDLTILP